MAGTGSGVAYPPLPPTPPAPGGGAGAVLAPRVGGLSGGTPWTGGSNDIPPAAPVDVLCYRPVDFRSMQKQHKLLKKGLDDDKRLSLGAEGKDNGSQCISLVSWIEEIRRLVETNGFDTVFRVYDGTTEKYLLSEWGQVTIDEVRD